jgi:uncharacterized protein
MDITPITPKDRLVIQRYGNEGFTVGDTRHEGNLLLTPDRLAPWSATNLNEVTEDTLAFFKENPPEILLIGTGRIHERLPDAVRDLLRHCGLKADAMDTGAACRTYNILVSEDRMVAAMLLAV